MKQINQFIDEKLNLNKESKVAQHTSNSEEDQRYVIEKNKKLLLYIIMMAEPRYPGKARKQSFERISPNDAAYELSKFNGKGYATRIAVKKEHMQEMQELMEKNGGWYFEYMPMSNYNHSYNKCIFALTDGNKSAKLLRGYDGCWTMSGEDYVSGESDLKEIELK